MSMKRRMLIPMSKLLGCAPRSAIQKAVQIMPTLGMLNLLILVSLITQSAPAMARGGTCTLKSIGSFGNTVVDIVANEAASATSEVEYSCSSPAKFDNVQFCTYVKALDGNPENDKTNNTFYQMRDKKVHLAWQMKLAAGGDMPLARLGASTSTAGWTHHANWSPANQDTTASQKLILTYLDRQQQDRVGSGLYNGNYQLVTQYKFNTGITSSCGSGIADPDGTITSNFNTTATVTKNCQMENFQDIDFGDHNSLEIASKSNGQVRAYGNVGVRCTYQTPYKISINTGDNPENDNPRLKSDNNFLPYKLLQEGCKTAWNDTHVRSGEGNTVNVIDNHQVCAQIITPLTIAPAPGTYADTVIVTATF